LGVKDFTDISIPMETNHTQVAISLYMINSLRGVPPEPRHGHTSTVGKVYFLWFLTR